MYNKKKTNKSEYKSTRALIGGEKVASCKHKGRGTLAPTRDLASRQGSWIPFGASLQVATHTGSAAKLGARWYTLPATDYKSTPIKHACVKQSYNDRSSQWYAPVGSSEYIMNWFSGLTLTKYLSNECRVSSQRKELASSNRRSNAATGSVRARPSTGLQERSVLSAIQGGVDFGLKQKIKSRVMDLRLNRSHLKTELDVLISHQNDLRASRQAQVYTKAVKRGNDLTSSISNTSTLNSGPQNRTSSQLIRIYQLIKRIDENNGRGVSAWPIDNRPRSVYAGLSTNHRTKYTYTESNVDNALDAVSIAEKAPRSALNLQLSAPQSRGLQPAFNFVASPASPLAAAIPPESVLSRAALPIKASFIAHFLATKLAAPKNKQFCMKSGKGGSLLVVRNAPTRNLALVLDRLSAVSKPVQGDSSQLSRLASGGFTLIGAKISCSGRLQGVEMAKKEWSTFGRIQSNTIEVIKDKAHYVAKTRYGSIGVSVSLSYKRA